MGDEAEKFIMDHRKVIDTIRRQRDVALDQAASWEAIAHTEHAKRIELEARAAKLEGGPESG